MVAMASDSYAFKVAPTPCQCACPRPRSRSRSCSAVGLVVALVLIVSAILALAGFVFCISVQMRKMRDELNAMHFQLHDVDEKMLRLNIIEQMKTFETPMPADVRAGKTPDDFEDEDDEEGDDDSFDDTDPIYTDDEEYEIVENKASDVRRVVPPPLHPAGSIVASVMPAAQAIVDEVARGAEHDNVQVVQGSVRNRREASRRPQLRLYHTLQNPSPSENQWSEDGGFHGQPMYAERAPVAFVTPPWPRQLQASTATTATTPIASRRSRVMAGRHARRQGAQRVQPQQDIQSVPQDVPQDVAQVGRRPTAHGAHVQHLNNAETRVHWRRGVRSIDTSVDVDQTWRPFGPTVVEGPTIAAHFVGDTARHRGSHHYDDNGRLKHPSGEYADWRASPWVQDLGLDHHFRLNDSGSNVVVNTPGLYLVYAQVNYANDKDENGFWLYRNGHKELLCAISGTGSTGAAGYALPRANTCFTAGVLHLSRGDRVSLRDLAGDRYRVLDHPGRSFIGLVSLHGCKLKTEQPSNREI